MLMHPLLPAGRVPWLLVMAQSDMEPNSWSKGLAPGSKDWFPQAGGRVPGSKDLSIISLDPVSVSSGQDH